MIMLAFMVIIGKVLLFRSEQEFPLVQCNKKSPKLSDLIILVEQFGPYHMDHMIWSISYGPYNNLFDIKSTRFSWIQNCSRHKKSRF